MYTEGVEVQDGRHLLCSIYNDDGALSVSVGGSTLVRALRVDEWAPPAGWRFGIGVTKEASTVDLKDLVRKFIPNSIGTQIEQACQSIYPLKDVYIRKVKTLKAPKFDITKLMEVHGNASESSSAPVPGQDEGTKLDRPNDGL